MESVKPAIPVLAALLLIAGAPAAHADDDNPLHLLVDTAAQRLQTADPVAAYKWVNGGSIEDPARVAQVLDTVGADASNRGIDPAYVREAFENQIHATEGVQYILFGHWKFVPAAAPASAPDLAESRTAIDGFNKSMVAEMAAQWGVLHGPTCPAALDAAKRTVAAERGLDPLKVDALAVATASYC
ncbi:chorismate mutase [Mycolicibacterium arenosum]|uniref:Chorismate mutase n=1 Tax=Mycolicibacterium arenosum TaxID=2952157 RepID=A0ABT1LXV9_9MYCO|nr:chorismate mutase [Mycolicibacterium sp. CAU 1645]MCP9271734.1 chorismate mutase [Mycolicibacterium sp. CAU 1645]